MDIANTAKTEKKKKTSLVTKVLSDYCGFDYSAESSSSKNGQTAFCMASINKTSDDKPRDDPKQRDAEINY